MLRNISQLCGSHAAIFQAVLRNDCGIRIASSRVNRWEDAMAIATLIDPDRTIKAGVRPQRAEGRLPTRSQVLDLAGEHAREPELKARAAQRPALVLRSAA
jgi:hypothetical protein